MAKNAQYYREYRARKKAERQETQGPAPLFAMIEGDKQPIPLDRRSYSLDDEETEAIKTEVLSTMGDVINFPPRPKTLEEQKETLICEVLEVAVTRYQEVVASKQPPKTVAQQVAAAAKGLRHHGPAVALATFLLGNTVFLVFQQYSFYTAAGYSVLVALATATLMEVALVIQSFMLASHRGILRLALTLTTLATVLTVAQVLHTGIATKTASTVIQGAEAEAIRKRISVFETLEASAIASISQLDPKTYPTKIEALRKRLNEPNGYSYEIAELRKELAGLANIGGKVATIQGQTLVNQQWLFLLLNLVLAHILGQMLKGSSSNVQAKGRLGGGSHALN